MRLTDTLSKDLDFQSADLSWPGCVNTLRPLEVTLKSCDLRTNRLRKNEELSYSKCVYNPGY